MIWGALSILTPTVSAVLVPGGGPVPLVWDASTEPGVMGYKLYYGTASRAYTEVIDAGNTTETTLPNLTPGETYYCAVTAYDWLGIESDFSVETEFLYPAQTPYDGLYDRLILLNAEKTAGAPIINPDGSVTVPDDSWFHLGFEAPIDADYVVWCRIQTPVEGTDVFFVSPDSGPEEEFLVYGTPTPPAGSFPSGWMWKRVEIPAGTPRKFRLSPGPHWLHFRGHKDACMDRVVLTTDPNFQPTDALLESGDAVAITVQPRSRTLSVGDATSLSVVAIGTGTLYFQWYKDGSPLTGETSPTLSIPVAQSADAGNYHVTVASGCAMESTGPIILQVVNGPPTLRISAMRIATDNSVSFDVLGELGSNLTIQASSDMVHWEFLGSAMNSLGTITIEDPNAKWFKRRFYRVSANTEK